MAAQEEDVDDGWGQVPQSLEQIEDWMKAGGKSLANSSSVGEPSQMDVLNEILLDEAEQKTLAAEWKVILAKADASSIHRKQTARILHLETKVEEYQWRIKDMILEKKVRRNGQQWATIGTSGGRATGETGGGGRTSTAQETEDGGYKMGEGIE